MTDKTNQTPEKTRDTSRRHVIVASTMAGLAIGMVGLSYAAVPLYQLFCQVTGYGGTTQRAETLPDTVLDKKIVVRFDANTSRGLGWDFQPVQRSMELKIGESVLAFYRAKNNSAKPVTGTATFNVSPAAAGSFFNKVECFCFTEQTLAPGEAVDMPVTFFIDPEIVKDREAKGISEITLSYTFFPVDDPEKVADAGSNTAGKDGS